MSETPELTGPDFTKGVPLSDVPDGGMLQGHAHGQSVLLARRGDTFFAMGSSCTHYGGPLGEGLMVGETVRCPWHHACFDLRTGVPVRAPAMRPLPRWIVEHDTNLVRVGRELPPAPEPPNEDIDRTKLGQRVVIVGGGVAADAAADMLRRQGHSGPITMIGNDPAPPVDRPNLSKDYLAGNAPEEWIPLRAPDFYSQQNITVLLGQNVKQVDRKQRQVVLDDGSTHLYDALLLATGATPVQLPDEVSGGQVRYLRTLADSRALIAASSDARRAVVIGASFIGLEVAASLRSRGVEVQIVAPESRPLEKVLGREIGDFIRRKHESHGVVFHLERSVARCDATTVTLDDGTVLPADLVVAGIGVRPNVTLAESAGLKIDRGVVVDETLATSDPDIFAAGDIARYPDPITGDPIRIEHFVVAQRQGQTAALNILGARKRFDDAPFFWSVHYDAIINYVGHAERWDDIHIDGDIDSMDCMVTYRSAGRVLAAASMGRDRANLETELALERDAVARIA